MIGTIKLWWWNVFYINFRDKIVQNYKIIRMKCVLCETLGTKLVNTLNIGDEKCIFPVCQLIQCSFTVKRRVKDLAPGFKDGPNYVTLLSKMVRNVIWTIEFWKGKISEISPEITDNCKELPSNLLNYTYLSYFYCLYDNISPKGYIFSQKS